MLCHIGNGSSLTAPNVVKFKDSNFRCPTIYAGVIGQVFPDKCLSDGSIFKFACPCVGIMGISVFFIPVAFLALLAFAAGSLSNPLTLVTPVELVNWLNLTTVVTCLSIHIFVVTLNLKAPAFETKRGHNWRCSLTRLREQESNLH
jgi:hypothetical protein